jgi:hypothetical protein
MSVCGWVVWQRLGLAGSSKMRRRSSHDHFEFHAVDG